MKVGDVVKYKLYPKNGYLWVITGFYNCETCKKGQVVVYIKSIASGNMDRVHIEDIGLSPHANLT